MLETLHRIVRAVSDAQDLSEALDAMVDSVRTALKVEQCSVYLFDPEEARLVLVATQGLRAEAVNQVRLSLGQGLAGAVGKLKHPIRLADASSDPRFVYFPETGEDRFKAFLGVPILHRKQLVGVAVVQAIDSRTFDAEDEAFLFTVSAQLAGILYGARIADVFGKRRVQGVPGFLEGIPGSPGIAIGTPVLPSEFAELDQVYDREDVNAREEEEQFLRSLVDFKNEMHQSSARLHDVLPIDVLELFESYVDLASDPIFSESVVQRIRQGQWAPAALRDTVADLAARFSAVDDERLRARAEDVRALGRRILLHLHPDAIERSAYPNRTVLVGEEVSVARIASVPTDQLAAIVSLKSSIHSHTVVMARSLGIPVVIGLGLIPLNSFAVDLLVVDGYQGQVFIDPPEASLNRYRQLEQEEADLARQVQAKELSTAETADHDAITILANIAVQADVEAALRVSAPGVGLYRTEFPFMVRESFPGEQEQTEIYKGVLDAFEGRSVTMRTLDIGGDKQLPYFPLNDPNPSLGLRGIRVCLNHPEILVTQIRAMLLADAGRGNLRIMIPMVSITSELVAARSIVEQMVVELTNENISVTMPEVGVMIEVPSLLFQLDEVASIADFVSIGTNDLTQYLMAADRDNPSVVDIYDQLQPSVLTAITGIVSRLKQLDVPVTVCGELANDPRGLIALTGMGVRSFSVAASSIGKTKWILRSFRSDEAYELLNKAQAQSDANGVRSLLDLALEERGLGGLIRAGK